MSRILTGFLLAVALIGPSSAAAQAINGTIEGTIVDDQGALLPGVTVTVSNVDTGDVRAVVTNENGLYRAQLLPLGNYRIAAELQGFKKFEQTGVTLRAGQTAVINVTLSVGAVAETDHRYRGFTGRRPGQDRARPYADRSGNQDPAAHLAQPL